jgi:hypothetical protein
MHKPRVFNALTSVFDPPASRNKRGRPRALASALTNECALVRSATPKKKCAASLQAQAAR